MQSGKALRRRRSAPPAPKACLECQKRKTKCILNNNDTTCSYCGRTGKRCVFEAPRERTALTRQNLDAAERRIAQLEHLLRSSQPGLDIDNTLRHIEPAEIRDVTSTQDELRRTSITSDDYEWHETGLPDSPEKEETVAAKDGMATLPVKGKRTGYLGKRFRQLPQDPFANIWQELVQLQTLCKLYQLSYQKMLPKLHKAGKETL
jgi:transcriptional regulatory protein GAL4